MSYIKPSQCTEWETPQALYNRLDEIFHFEIDGACTPQNQKAPIGAYTLDVEWDKPTFCNPPYGKTTVPKFVKKAYESHKEYDVDVVLLIPASTEIACWFKYIWDKPCYKVFLPGRIKFELNGEPAKNGSGKGSVLIVYTDRLISKELAQFGAVVV